MADSRRAKSSGASCGTHRLKQAHRAFAHTAEYDSVIANYLATGAPTTQTPAPPKRTGTSAIVAAVLAALVVLGIGGAVAVKKLGASPTTKLTFWRTSGTPSSRK